jgi:hypothetical protein
VRGAHRRRWHVAAAEIDGGLGDVLGLVLRNKDCLRSTPLHEKEDKLPRSGGSPKRGDLAVARRRRGGAPTKGRGAQRPREQLRGAMLPRDLCTGEERR